MSKRVPVYLSEEELEEIKSWAGDARFAIDEKLLEKIKEQLEQFNEE